MDQFYEFSNEIQTEEKCEGINKIITTSIDTILILWHKSQNYDYYSIRQGKCLLKGKLPENFHPSSYISRGKRLKEGDVMFYEQNTGVLCRLDIKKNVCELGAIGKIEKEGQTVNYYWIDGKDGYILKIVKSEPFRMKISAICWSTKKQTNTIELDKNYFNYKIIDDVDEGKQTLIEIISSGEKFTTLHYCCIEFCRDKFALQLLTRQRNDIVYTFVPIGGFRKNHYLYLVANSAVKGCILLRYNIEQNSVNRGKIVMSRQTKQLKENNKGYLVKKALGYHHDQMFIELQDMNQPTRTTHLLRLPITEKLVTMKMDEGILAFTLPLQSKNVALSFDSLSFNIYEEKNEEVVEKLRNEGEKTASNINIKQIFRLPKKYYYSELISTLQLPQNLRVETLSIL